MLSIIPNSESVLKARVHNVHNRLQKVLPSLDLI